MSWVDALVLLWVVLSAVIGYQRGLSAQLLSLAGLAIGGLIGARVGPLFLPGGDDSPWVPFASLIGASSGRCAAGDGEPRRHPSAVGDLAQPAAAGRLRRRRRDRHRRRARRRLAGRRRGASDRREPAFGSACSVVHPLRARRRVPPRSVLRTLARLDPLPLIAAPPDLGLPPPDGSVLRTGVTPKVRQSVVKVESVACGAGVQGSGWVVRRRARGDERPRRRRRARRCGWPLSTIRCFRPRSSTSSQGTTWPTCACRVSARRRSSCATKAPSDDQVVLLGYPRDGAADRSSRDGREADERLRARRLRWPDAAAHRRAPAREGAARRQRRSGDQRQRPRRGDDLRREHARCERVRCARGEDRRGSRTAASPDRSRALSLSRGFRG